MFAGGGQHGQEPAPVAVDVAHVVAGGELAVGDVEEVAASQERAQVWTWVLSSTVMPSAIQR
ncbi:hypothetical protein H7H69_22535 [Mycobacterium heckeshornense]|uniref:hypothetical protein n=1 Tax=Mycobacterium heckeshornense TaxID=110505 RepID=UPI000704B149|nr:hypothetical protein [Mycobacterium heckeshornense]MCV7036891.1 hypothetical protein [Mycobacterium heckeshornense]